MHGEQQYAARALKAGTHKSHVLEKLGLGSTAELVRYALDHKLV
jgi:DNA-binding NarL/FixJ family response regulator